MVYCDIISAFCNRLREKVGFDVKPPVRKLVIGHPTNFKKETLSLPGLSAQDIAELRERAAASRMPVQPPSPAPPSSHSFVTPPRGSGISDNCSNSSLVSHHQQHHLSHFDALRSSPTALSIHPMPTSRQDLFPPSPPPPPLIQSHNRR